ncbi:hypothetical protein Bpfe_026272 [Biomphalaria pfeifferi]|uniref:Uncharacterized protein n=1 Tax=Biomphalaria pfeifferi TaxID=112525 RepID=A0AAD8B095_BIOPF|nr:hypothetical protein Bpfe_026272 [Biomphalaria pfeifferi]
MRLWAWLIQTSLVTALSAYGLESSTALKAEESPSQHLHISKIIFCHRTIPQNYSTVLFHRLAGFVVIMQSAIMLFFPNCKALWLIPEIPRMLLNVCSEVKPFPISWLYKTILVFILNATFEQLLLYILGDENFDLVNPQLEIPQPNFNFDANPMFSSFITLIVKLD